MTLTGNVTVPTFSSVVNEKDATFDIQGDWSITSPVALGLAATLFTNKGKLIKSAGSGVATIGTSSFDNQAALIVGSGTLYFTCLLGQSQSLGSTTLYDGTYLQTDSSLSVNGGSIGTIGSCTVIGDLIVNGSDVFPGGGDGHLSDREAAIRGPGQLAVTGNYTQRGGTVNIDFNVATEVNDTLEVLGATVDLGAATQLVVKTLNGPPAVGTKVNIVYYESALQGDFANAPRIPVAGTELEYETHPDGLPGIYQLWVEPRTKPKINALLPNLGPAAGGTPIVITGDGFSAATAVAFNGTPAETFQVLSDTEIEVDSPPHSPGVVDVTVNDGDITSDVTSADQFTYYQATDDHFSTERCCDQSTVITGNVFNNDGVPANAGVTAIVTSYPANGTLDFDSSTGQFTYTTYANYAESDSFTYELEDSYGAEDSATVYLTTTNHQTTTAPDSSGSGSAVCGQAIILSVTVGSNTPCPDPAPSGTAEFYVDGQDKGSAPLTGSNGSASASLDVGPLPVATHHVFVRYGGDGLYGSSSVSYDVTVNQASTATALSATPNPADEGQVVTLTATVSSVSPSSSVPQGTVTFRDGNTTLGTATLVNGQASFDTTALSADSHDLTAVFSGNNCCGGSTSSVVSLTVNHVNENDYVSVQVSAGDPDGDTLTYSASNLPSGLAIDPSSGWITGAVAYGTAGTYSVTLIVTDAGGLSDSAVITWTVAHTSQPPQISSPGDQYSNENDTVALQISASDPDNDSLTFSATGLPSGLSINPATGQITGAIPYGAAGSYYVTLTVTDPSGASANVTFTWNVAHTNRAPQITTPGGQTSYESTWVSFTISASDPDGDALYYSASNLPPILSFDPSSGTVSGTIVAGSAGSYTVVVTVTAPYGASDSVMFNWTVLPS